jgi:hypothetical protein
MICASRDCVDLTLPVAESCILTDSVGTFFLRRKKGLGRTKVETNGLQRAQFEGFLFPVDHSNDAESMIKELDLILDPFTTFSVSKIDKTAEDAMDRFAEFAA